ncbi:MAG: hypothetical protein ABIG30_03635, partial [Candidatus Aenigmatarchaeota archaeon]
VPLDNIPSTGEWTMYATVSTHGVSVLTSDKVHFNVGVSSTTTVAPSSNVTISAVWTDKDTYVVGESAKFYAKVINQYGDPYSRGATVYAYLIDTVGGVRASKQVMTFNTASSYYEYKTVGLDTIPSSGEWTMYATASDGVNTVTSDKTHFKVSESATTTTILPKDIIISIPAAWTDKTYYSVSEKVIFYAKVIDQYGNPSTPGSGTTVDAHLVDPNGVESSSAQGMLYNINSGYYEYVTDPISEKAPTGTWVLFATAKNGANYATSDKAYFKINGSSTTTTTISNEFPVYLNQRFDIKHGTTGVLKYTDGSVVKVEYIADSTCNTPGVCERAILLGISVEYGNTSGGTEITMKLGDKREIITGLTLSFVEIAINGDLPVLLLTFTEPTTTLPPKFPVYLEQPFKLGVAETAYFKENDGSIVEFKIAGIGTCNAPPTTTSTVCEKRILLSVDKSLNNVGEGTTIDIAVGEKKAVFDLVVSFLSMSDDNVATLVLHGTQPTSTTIPPENYCVDPDADEPGIGGINGVYTPSTTEGYEYFLFWKNYVEKTDYCSDNVLTEYMCNSDGTISSAAVRCTNGCTNGPNGGACDQPASDYRKILEMLSTCTRTALQVNTSDSYWETSPYPTGNSLCSQEQKICIMSMITRVTVPAGSPPHEWGENTDSGLWPCSWDAASVYGRSSWPVYRMDAICCKSPSEITTTTTTTIGGGCSIAGGICMLSDRCRGTVTSGSCSSGYVCCVASATTITTTIPSRVER